MGKKDGRTVSEFVSRWKAATGTERSLAQSHFNDLCEMLGQAKPASDVTQERYAFEKSVLKTGGGQGVMTAIADAARALVQERDAWLNSSNATPAELKTRTLTNLYNQRPDWLAARHAALDAAVCAACAHTTGEPWSPTLSDDDLLARLLALNLHRAE